ncbi:MAG: MFS transporter [Endomicrobiaceae bacterium]|nr:MFS transporter [Endomicrobiaceae bacterium]
MKNLIKTIFNRSYFPLYVAQYLGTFNDNFFRTALAAFIMFGVIPLAEKSRSLIVSLLIALFMLPFFLFSATSGELADKYSKDAIIKIVKLLQLFVAMLAVAGFMLQNVWILLIVLFLMGILSTVFSPVKFSVLPEILEHDQLIAGNSLIQAGTYISMLQGIICGSIICSFDSKWLFIIMLAVAAAGVISSLFIPSLKPALQKFDISKNFIKTTWKNMSYFKQTRDIYLCILGISWFWFIGVVLVSQIPNFAKIALHGQEVLYLFLLGLFAVGISVGSILSYFLLKKEISIKHVPISALFMTVFIVDLSFVANQINLSAISIGMDEFILSFSGKRIIFDLFAFSVVSGLYIVPLMTMLQVVSNRKIRGRVFAVNNVINVLFMLAGVIVCSAFVEASLTMPATLTLIAVFNVIGSIYICGLLPAHLLRIITKRVLSIFYTIDVRGIENFEKCKGGTLIIANHTSLLDGIILSTTLGEKVSFAINTDVSKKFWVKPFLKLIKYFPIDNSNVMVVKSIIDELKKGGIVAIFPEGRITTTGGLMKIYPGPAVVADKSNADILPVCIEGSQYSDFSYFGEKTKSRRQRKIRLTILPPRKLGVDSTLPDNQRRNVSVTKLYDIMCEMKYASSSINNTIFNSLIQTISLVGRNKEILDDMNRRPITFGSFLGAVFAFSKQILKQTKDSEYVGLMLPNTKTSAEIFFALSAVNRIPCMINYTENIKNISACMKNAGITKVYTSKSFVDESNLNEITDVLTKNNIEIFYVEDLKEQLKFSDKFFAYLMSYFPKRYYKIINTNIDASNPAVVLFTSNFEGKIKSVVLSHKNIQANRGQLSSVMDFGIMDSFFNSMPIFHSFGIVAGMLLPLLRGIKVFMYHSPLHYRMVSELVYDTNSTVILGTDTFLNGYAKTAHPYDFYSVRFVIAGVEKLREETVKIWEENFGIRIFEAYGTAETSSTLSVNTPMYFKSGSVGRFLPSIEYKLEPMSELSSGSRLIVKGPNITNSHINNLNTSDDGWFDTGDIVTVDEDGFVFVEGKIKRFAKIDGESVSLSAIEVAVSNIWQKDKHAVININRKNLLILFTTNQSATIDELEKISKEQEINGFIIPSKIIVLEEIPITGTGATDYLKLTGIAKGFLNIK